MEENIVTRLNLFIETNGLTSSQFADMCGIARPTISQILSGRNQKISDILITKIHQAFPELSISWLMFGEGPVKVGGSDVRLGSVVDSRDASVDSTGRIDGTEQNSVDENSFDSTITTNRSVYSNLSGLSRGEAGLNVSKNQIFESEMRIVDLQKQIKNMKQNPRKVIQITIYYDDSTFETFVPK